MRKKRSRPTPETKLNVGIKSGGHSWHIGVLVVRGHDVYFEATVTDWPPSVKFSYHASGQRHLKVGGINPKRLFGAAPELRPPPCEVRAPEFIARFTILRGHISRQPEYGVPPAPAAADVLLDADAHSLADDAETFFRVYFAPDPTTAWPPSAANVGPLVQQLVSVGNSLPAIALCLFQERT